MEGWKRGQWRGGGEDSGGGVGGEDSGRGKEGSSSSHLSQSSPAPTH